MFKPQHTLLFLLAVGSLSALLMTVFPKDGIQLTDEFALNFATWEDFAENDTVQPLDVEELLASYEEPFDSVAFKDSVKLYEFEARQRRLRIHYQDSGVHLAQFFASITDDSKKEKIRIIHYGDSQIEGDRISSFLRDKLQDEFGGRGPGYAPPINQVPSMSLKQSNSEHWIRYTVFGKKDTTVTHKDFGLYGIFGRFTPYTIPEQPDTIKAWVEFEKSNLGYSGTRVFRTVKMLYGNAPEPFKLTVYQDEEVIYSEWLSANGNNQSLNLTFSAQPKKVRFEFEGIYSPDIYGFQFENGRGVVVDNVAMRGSSGTVFGKISGSQLRKQYRDANAKLIILQYGGNTVPYVKTKKKAESYGKWMGQQIKLIKRYNPGADIVFIGPSDMATKVKTEYKTFPFLIDVRDVLKKVALENGCGFWDIYEVMGGENSMQSWVNAEPPLAAKDYVHFTPKGARHVAQLFYDALMKDYEIFLNDREAKLRAQEIQDSLKNHVVDTLMNDSAPQS